MKQLLIVIASLLLGALAQDLRRTIPTPLYVWGNGIPGLSLFYADGAVVLASNITAAGTDNFLPLKFVFLPTPGVPGWLLTVAPDTDSPLHNNATSNPPFSNTTFFVGVSGSVAHETGLLNSTVNVTEVRNDHFALIDNQFYLIQQGGLVTKAVFCAIPTASKDIWSLNWNMTDDTPGGLPVRLRTFRYPTGSSPPTNEGTSCKTLAASNS